MIQIFEGDPKIFIDKNGAKFIFKSGQPVMDAGVENAAIISLFTKKGWWGNFYFEGSQQIGSDFEKTVKGTINRLYFVRVEDSARRALKWMIDENIVNEIDVEVVNPESNRTEVTIILYPPGRNSTELLLINNGTNWIFQTTNPAYRRQ